MVKTKVFEWDHRLGVSLCRYRCARKAVAPTKWNHCLTSSRGKHTPPLCPSFLLFGFSVSLSVCDSFVLNPNVLFIFFNNSYWKLCLFGHIFQVLHLDCHVLWTWSSGSFPKHSSPWLQMLWYGIIHVKGSPQKLCLAGEQSYLFKKMTFPKILIK